MQLARLRIPTGWRVAWNTLPEIALDDALSCEHLTEDLLVLENDRRGVAIDLGWLPDRSPEGRFVLTAVKLAKGDGDDMTAAWNKPLRTFESTSFAGTKHVLESWLEDDSLVWHTNHGTD